jgi:hypothetical protein
MRSVGVSGLQRRAGFSEKTLVWLTPAGQTGSVMLGTPMGFLVPVTQGPA